MVERFPNVRRGLEAVAAERSTQNQQRMQTVQSVPIDQFLSQGLIEAQSLLVLDLQKCTRCDACVEACADAHDGVTRLVREGLRSNSILWQLPAGNAATRCAWWDVRLARFAGAIRSK